MSLAVSNVVGSTTPFHLFGAVATLVMGFVPPPTAIPCAVGVLSYGGDIFVSVTADGCMKVPPRALLDKITGELRALVATE